MLNRIKYSNGEIDNVGNNQISDVFVEENKVIEMNKEIEVIIDKLSDACLKLTRNINPFAREFYEKEAKTLYNQLQEVGHNPEMYELSVRTTTEVLRVLGII